MACARRNNDASSRARIRNCEGSIPELQPLIFVNRSGHDQRRNYERCKHEVNDRKSEKQSRPTRERNCLISLASYTFGADRWTPSFGQVQEVFAKATYVGSNPQRLQDAQSQESYGQRYHGGPMCVRVEPDAHNEINAPLHRPPQS